MLREVISTGVNVDEAVAEACLRLGVSRDDVSVEVLEMPQRKLFGMSPAKVRVTTETEQPAPAPEAAPAPRSERRERRERPRRENREPRESREPREPREEQPEKTIEPYVPDETETPLTELGEAEQKTLDYLKAVAEKLGAVKMSYEVVVTESGVKIKADGEDAAILIGRRGETMEALQYLCSLVFHRSEKSQYERVIIDIACYRRKRERSLQQLAKNTAVKVQRTHRQQTLEPMNPYERRIIHSTVQKVNGVKSESIGEEPHRRVVIMPEGGRGRGGKGRRKGDRQDRRPSAAPAAAPAKTSHTEPRPAEGQGLPLYSKIEL